jgi:hypothetical protein
MDAPGMDQPAVFGSSEGGSLAVLLAARTASHRSPLGVMAALHARERGDAPGHQRVHDLQARGHRQRQQAPRADSGMPAIADDTTSGITSSGAVAAGACFFW